MSAKLLRKWSRLIKIRDRGKCVLCSVTPGAGRVQSHHIMPRALYPDLALKLSNGVCLCARCHKCVVHCERINDGGHWRKFVGLFLAYTRTRAEWNEQNQGRL